MVNGGSEDVTICKTVSVNVFIVYGPAAVWAVNWKVNIPAVLAVPIIVADVDVKEMLNPGGNEPPERLHVAETFEVTVWLYRSPTHMHFGRLPMHTMFLNTKSHATSWAIASASACVKAGNKPPGTV